ncbi:hypothetical protein I4U23_016843 [Adineta vaga]|nr:hypothetical protein I4U23_016843 [Adineta vaga]
MTRFFQQLLLFFLAVLIFLIQLSTEDKSVFNISSLGRQFVPFDNSLPPLLTFTAKRMLYCSLECNKRIDCRTYDFDSDSKQCRLWDVDTTTGFVVASPSKPRSVVGTIRLSFNTYVHSHNQSCNKCFDSRYELCDTNSNTCQCPLKTFWNGSMCLVQLLRNQICSGMNVCRSDLNLSCQPSCDFTYRCSDPPTIGVGQTVAGFCNGTIGTGSSGIIGPWSISFSSSDGVLYVIDWDRNNVQAFSPFVRTGITLFNGSSSGQLGDITVDNSNTIYITDRFINQGIVYALKVGKNISTFPAAGLSTSSCLYTGLYTAYGIAVDRSNNIYVSMFSCYMVVKWANNTTSGTLVGGKPGIMGSTSTTMGYVRFIALDEDRNALYVSDVTNTRIQKFIIGGNGTGVTVAGNGGVGVGLNQFSSPSGLCITRDGQTLYVADYYNNRVMKWTIGATAGSVVAGDANGAAGATSQLLKLPGNIALDPTETYLYVADYGNHRIQRFRIK